jgi:hypothetical protein
VISKKVYQRVLDCSMHRPGIEPGAGRHFRSEDLGWQRPILPLNHQCLMMRSKIWGIQCLHRRRNPEPNRNPRSSTRGSTSSIMTIVSMRDRHDVRGFLSIVSNRTILRHISFRVTNSHDSRMSTKSHASEASHNDMHGICLSSAVSAR